MIFFSHISSELTVSEMNLGLGIGTLFSSFFTLFLFFLTDVYYLLHHSFKPHQGFLNTKIYFLGLNKKRNNTIFI